MITDELKAVWAEQSSAGAPFEIGTEQVRGIEMKVFRKAPPNMRVVWEATGGATREGTGIVFEDERYSHAEIAAQVRSLAHFLYNVEGVRSGDRVAIAMRNYPEWVVAYWATLCLGAAAVGMNAWWTASEMEYGLRDSAPKVLICDSERLERVLPIRANLSALAIVAVRCATLPEGVVAWSDVVSVAEAPADLPPATIAPDDDACIFYTSGTTGFPKGAQLTHRGCVNNLMSLLFWGAVSVAALERSSGKGGDVSTKPITSTAAPVYLATTPLFHVTANNCVLYPATYLGATLVLMYKWDPKRALELIERERVTNFSGVPTMSRELLSHADWAVRDTSSLVGMGGGGAALQPDLVGKIDSALKTGKPTTGYGLTETHGIVTAVGAEFFVSKPASCGPVMPTFDYKLVDDNDVIAGPGEPGQLCVKGPGVIKGYLNRPDATANAIREGWFNTGDIAKIDDDGFVYIVDRAKDMVIRGGENVYCSEVETAIFANDAVAEAAVFGNPEERLGEEVCAAVYLHPGAILTEADLRTFLAKTLAPFKIPSKIWFLTEPLPRNANGKFVKRDLKRTLTGL